MGTRSTIQLNVDPRSVLKRLPQRFRQCVVISAIGEEPVDVVVFETGEGHVVSSKDFKKALLAYTSSPCRLLVIGYDFTQEVRLAVHACGGMLFSERNFGWSDDRWHTVRQR